MIKDKNKFSWHLKVQGGNEERSGKNSGGQIKNNFENYENNSKNKNLNIIYCPVFIISVPSLTFLNSGYILLEFHF